VGRLDTMNEDIRIRAHGCVYISPEFGGLGNEVIPVTRLHFSCEDNLLSSY
jgi:hypothetical protein